MSVIQPEVVERADGTLVLPSNADPACAMHQVLGWRRLSVGLDIGGRGDDPSALVIVRSECRPFFTGRGFEQALGLPRYTVVFSETVKCAEATDVVDWLARRLQQLKNWSLTADSSGLGGPVISMIEAAKIPVTAVTMTAGSALNRKGNRVTCSKSILFENAASLLETGQLQIAHNLPERQELMNEITSVEFKETSAGNLVLQGGGRGHHADRFVGLCLALLHETHIGGQRFTTSKIANYW